MIKITIHASIVIQYQDLFYSIWVGEFLERVALFFDRSELTVTIHIARARSQLLIVRRTRTKQTNKQKKIDDDKIKTLYKCVSSFVDTSTTKTIRLPIHNDFLYEWSVATNWMFTEFVCVCESFCSFFFGMRLCTVCRTWCVCVCERTLCKNQLDMSVRRHNVLR